MLNKERIQMKYKISVVIPMFNSEKYISECLDSVISQSLDDIEIICIDDGSTDDTTKIVRHYMEINKFITLVEQTNHGAGFARNIGINLAQGKYVAFIDSDDFFYHRDVLLHMFKCACENDSELCGANLIYYENGCYHQECMKPYLTNQCDMKFYDMQDIYGFTRFIYRIDFLRDNGLVFPETSFFEDPIFLLNVMLKASKISSICDVAYVYRYMHGDRIYNGKEIETWLIGIKYCLEKARDHNLEKLYYLRFEGFCSSPYFLKILCKATDMIETVWDLINDIYEIDVNWLGKDCLRITKEYVNAILVDALTAHNNVMEHCNRAGKVLIYGAGKVGTQFLELYNNLINNICGIAVTNVDDVTPHQIGGVLVKSIFSYNDIKDEVLVIVAVGERYKKEVNEVLLSNGYNNVENIDIHLLNKAKSLRY